MIKSLVMVTVKSPYNFVPAPVSSGEVFLPRWANHVSHDIPFSDGVSGELRISIIARTPIFVRNGQSKDSTDNSFSHVEIQGIKRYFIPATSLKGMLRSVLEVISRSKMRYINDHRHAVRQIIKTKNEVADEGYTLTNEKKNIFAGYLIKREDGFYIYPCGKPYKIRYTELDKILPIGRKFSEHFRKNGRANIENNFNNRSAAYKYVNLLKGENLERRFEVFTVEKGRPESWVSEKYQPLDYVRFADGEDNEVFWGRIVCTGQAMTYDKKQARKGEYVFRGRREDVLGQTRNRIKVDDAVMQSFLLICRDGEHDEVEDWKYWKNDKKKGIPVFFRYKNPQKKEGIRDFGLTFMYKEPVRSSTAECLEYSASAERPDFVETLFGYVGKEDSDALKGRVMISHAFAVGDPQPLDARKIVLATPKSSYYPFYLKQSGNNGKTRKFNTYNHNPRLRGYKRYPVRASIADHQPKVDNENIISTIEPLPAGTEFVGRIRFHNLKPVELGGLLSALTFHGQGDQYFHSLGGAKPFGYGRVQLQVEHLLLVDGAGYRAAPVDEFLEAFACEMKNHDPKWHESEYWKELLAMASLSDDESSLAYMDLNDFKKLKEQGLFLQDYSSLTNFQLKPLEACADPKSFAQLTEKGWKRWETQRDSLTSKHLEARIQQELVGIEKAISNGNFEDALVALDHLEQNAGRCTEKIIELRKNACLGIVQKMLDSIHSQEELDNKKSSLFLQFSEIRDAVEEKIKTKEAELRAERNARKAQEVKAPFEFGDDFLFDRIKKIINKKYDLLKKIDGHFTEEQLRQIEEAVRKSFEAESKRGRHSKFHHRGQPRSFNQFPWTDIQRWLGKERAEALYDELIEI